jgi:hypothetical protein
MGFLGVYNRRVQPCCDSGFDSAGMASDAAISAACVAMACFGLGSYAVSAGARNAPPRKAPPWIYLGTMICQPDTAPKPTATL